MSSYLSQITHVLAANQGLNLRPMHMNRIRQAIIAENFQGSRSSSFSEDEFRTALNEGVDSRRFVRVRDSYLLVNDSNEAYDPRTYEQWLDDEDFDDSQRQAMWLDYECQFGLHDN